MAGFKRLSAESTESLELREATDNKLENDLDSLDDCFDLLVVEIFQSEVNCQEDSWSQEER